MISLFKRNDIAMAITKYDQFDFLIDIVPRDELKPVKRQVRFLLYFIMFKKSIRTLKKGKVMLNIIVSTLAAHMSFPELP